MNMGQHFVRPATEPAPRGWQTMTIPGTAATPERRVHVAPELADTIRRVAVQVSPDKARTLAAWYGI